MNAMWGVLVISALVQVRAEFFHEPSRIELWSSGALKTSDFGFSMAFQDAPSRLVVGAPQKDYVGKVYNCPLTDLSKDVDCSMIDMSSLKIEENTEEARMDRAPDQKYFFGASIAATSDYFLTCAPLLPKYITAVLGKKTSKYPVSGACYLYDNRTSTFSEWKDSIYKQQNIINIENNFERKYTDIIKGGGMGWNTLMDTNNGYLLVAKPAIPVDILSVHTINPLAQSDSLLEDYISNKARLILSNTGYGMTVGNFFDKSVPLYAISTQHQNLKGSIMFLTKNTKNSLYVLGSDKEYIDTISLKNDDLGTMFGYALAAADINLDGLSELIVGAPTQPDEDKKQEFGAIHIYIGGDLETRNDVNRKRTILGTQENGRFGSVIATSDIDGDNISEIIVSAPYENMENGAVYVISGFELNQILLSPEGRQKIRLTDLKLTQHLRGDGGMRHFGFSVQVVQDLNHNGCDELAIGSPASSKVQLLRCLPAVTANTTLKLLGDKIVKEDAKSFTVDVCLTVIINQNCESFTGSIQVTSKMTGDTHIPSPTFLHPLTTLKKQETCQSVTVILNRSGSGVYTFSTSIKVAESDRNGNRKDKGYKSWAVLSSHSKLENSIDVQRYCTGVECEPKLNLTMIWTGGDTIETSSTPSENQAFIIRVNNMGPDVKTASVRVFVKGARISQLTEQCFEENGVGEYSCALPKPLKRDSFSIIKVWINTTDATNVPYLEFTAQLHDEVFTNITYYPETLQVPFTLDTNSVLVNGSNHNLQITDEDMQDKNIDSFSDNHEYYIINNGAVTWQDITAVLEIKKEPYIQTVQTVTTESCAKHPSSDSHSSKYLFSCTLTLRPGTTNKIAASFLISKKSIASDISKITLNTSSTLSLLLYPTEEKKRASLSTQMNYKEILAVGNNMALIILIVVVVAVILLLLISFVLYKCGFFKRAEKQKLDVLRESVRRRSVRKASGSFRSQKPSTADENHCEIEVVDDCVFQEVDISPQTEEVPSKDNVELIKESPELKHSS